METRGVGRAEKSSGSVLVSTACTRELDVSTGDDGIGRDYIYIGGGKGADGGG
jgi:hypothetical protein